MALNGIKFESQEIPGLGKIAGILEGLYYLDELANVICDKL